MTRRRAPRGEGARLRAEIIEAAGRLLEEKGDSQAVSVREIAEACGVTPPSIYMHFPDKDTLMAEVCLARFTEAEQLVTSALSGADDPGLALREACRAYVRFAIRHPAQFRVLFLSRTAAALSSLEQAQSPVVAALAGFVRRSVDRGAFRSVDPIMSAKVLWTTLNGIVTEALAGTPDTASGVGAVETDEPEALVDYALDVQLQGLLPH